MNESREAKCILRSVNESPAVRSLFLCASAALREENHYKFSLSFYVIIEIEYPSYH